MIAAIQTPTSLNFHNADDAPFDITINYLDGNNVWQEVVSETEQVSYTYYVLADGFYNISTDTDDTVVSYVFLSYAKLKLKLRTYIKEIMCSTCNNKCAPCDSRKVYNVNILIHLSLAYLGNNTYLLNSECDITDPDDIADIEAINNAIQRSTKYIMTYDI